MAKVFVVMVFMSLSVLGMQHDTGQSSSRSEGVLRHDITNDSRAKKRKSTAAVKRVIDREWNGENSTVLTFLDTYKNKKPWSKDTLQQYVDTLNEKLKSAVNMYWGDRPVLVFAAQSHNSDLVKLLVDCGADVNWPPLYWFKSDDGTPSLVSDEVGDTPLLAALSEGGSDIHDLIDLYNLVVYLVEHGADVNKPKQKYGDTPLGRAMDIGDRTLIKYLVENGADVNHDSWRASPFSRAIASLDLGLVNSMLKNGADLNTVSPFSTVISSCAKSGSGVMAILERHGANVNEEDALCLAAQMGNFERIKQLVRYGADVNRENSDGKTPLQIARQSAKEIEDFLISKGAH